MEIIKCRGCNTKMPQIKNSRYYSSSRGIREALSRGWVYIRPRGMHIGYATNYWCPTCKDVAHDTTLPRKS